MARAGKVSLDYFSHDVDMMQDNKIRLLKAKYGLLGYAVFLRLLEELYRSNGYYLKVGEDFNILFADENNLDFELYLEVLEFCIDKSLFSRELFTAYGILTSERIQKNYCDSIGRRKEASFFEEYLLVKPSECVPERSNVNIIILNVDILPLNGDTGTQSKVKESKVYKHTPENPGEVDVFFETIWKLYPEKKGKPGVAKKSKEALFKLGLDEVTRRIDRYKDYIQVKRDGGFNINYQNGSTFFNSGHEDYAEIGKVKVELTKEQLEIMEENRR